MNQIQKALDSGGTQQMQAVKGTGDYLAVITWPDRPTVQGMPHHSPECALLSLEDALDDAEQCEEAGRAMRNTGS